MTKLLNVALVALATIASQVPAFAEGEKPATNTAPLTYSDYPKPWPFRNLVTPGVLTIAVTPDSPPGTFLDLKTQQIDGWTPAIWRQMANDLGLKVEFVSVDWASVLPGLASNRFDLGCGGAAWTSTRLTSPDFLLTNPIVITSTVAVARKDAAISSYDATKGKTMGGVRGEVYFEGAKAKLKDVKDAVDFPGLNEALLALSNGQIDFFVTNKYNANYALNGYQGASDLAMVHGPAIATFPESLCVNSRSPDLLTAVNLLLGNYRADGQLKGWFQKYTGNTSPVDELPASGY